MIGIGWIELGNTASFLGLFFSRRFRARGINIGAGVKIQTLHYDFGAAIHDPTFLSQNWFVSPPLQLTF